MYKLITHTDLDGASCAVLANIAWGKDVEITYCHNPVEVTAELLKLNEMEAWKKYNVIYITDISFDISIVPQCKKLKNILRLFDHHETTIKPFEPYKKWATVQVMLNEKLTCGTELFYHYLIHKGLIKHRDFFVELVRLYDTWDWSKTNSKLPKYLSNIVMKIGLQYFVREFTERLKYRDVNELNLFTEQERIVLQFDDERESKDIYSFLNQTVICKIYNETICPVQKEFKVGVIYNSSYYSSQLGNDMCTYLGVDIAFMVNLNRERVEVRTARDDIDLGKLMKDRYQGGGHQKVAGGYLKILQKISTCCLEPLGEVLEVTIPAPNQRITINKN